jgi:hypothetical protein
MIIVVPPDCLIVVIFDFLIIEQSMDHLGRHLARAMCSALESCFLKSSSERNPPILCS